MGYKMEKYNKNVKIKSRQIWDLHSMNTYNEQCKEIDMLSTTVNLSDTKDNVLYVVRNCTNIIKCV